MGNSKVRWVPLPNGFNTGRIGQFEFQIGLESGQLYIINVNQNRKTWVPDLPPDLKMCRAESVPDEGITSEIADTIDAALHFLRRSDNIEMHGNQTERIDRAYAWLQTQTKGNDND